MNEISKAMLIMTLTLLGYTLGVQYENRVETKKPLHLVLLWASFCLNAVGFGLLTRMIADSQGFVPWLCRAMGIVALVILMLHSIWGTAVLVLKEEKGARIYHRDGKLLWKIWIVPFVIEIMLALVI